jgi:hypothetical protein
VVDAPKLPGLPHIHDETTKKLSQGLSVLEEFDGEVIAFEGSLWRWIWVSAISGKVRKG